MADVSFREACKACGWENSYSRLRVVMDLRTRMSRWSWFRLLGHQWTSCDNIWEWRAEVARELMTATPAELNRMMRPTERRTLAELPDTLTVYRGCYDFNADGLSWTIDQGLAEKFVTLNRYHRTGYQPYLLTGHVSKAACVLKTDRKESEIISPSVRRITRREIPMINPAPPPESAP